MKTGKVADVVKPASQPSEFFIGPADSIKISKAKRRCPRKRAKASMSNPGKDEVVGFFLPSDAPPTRFARAGDKGAKMDNPGYVPSKKRDYLEETSIETMDTDVGLDIVKAGIAPRRKRKDLSLAVQIVGRCRYDFKPRLKQYDEDNQNCNEDEN